MLVPLKQTIFDNNDNRIFEKKYIIELKKLTLDRFVFSYQIIEEYDFLSKTATRTFNTLDDNGRLYKNWRRTYNEFSFVNNIYNVLDKDLLHSETQTYTYQTLPLSGYQTKTVPTKIITTQQYGSSSSAPVITNTATFGYTNEGRLSWEQTGNANGTVKTEYSDFTPTGCYGKKTVTAGNVSRTETYTYDATQRFVNQIQNFDFPNFITKFEYDAKTGNKTSETDINALKTTYQYNAFGNLTKIIYPDDTQTTLVYRWHTGSNPPNAKYYTTTTSSGKPELKVYYDVLGREVCRMDDGYYYQTVYNNKGQVEETSGPFRFFGETDLIRHEYTYDNFGRKLTEKAPYIDLAYSYNNRKITVTDKLRGNIQSWKDYDALGRITEAKDEGGMITYDYTVTSNKRDSLTIKHNGTVITTISSDLWGNRLLIKEANAGLVTSTYNGFNELITQKDARGNTTTYQHDKLGRVIQKQNTGLGIPVKTTYFYDNGVQGIGKLSRINNQIAEIFTYDQYGRLADYTKVICGVHFSHKYTYTVYGQLDTLTYPDDFAVKYKYSSTGKLVEIRNGSDNSLIYKVLSRNKFNAPLHCEYGNGVLCDYSYNENGLLTRINTGKKTTAIIYDPGGGGDERGGETTGVNQLTYAVDSAILNYRYAYDTKGLMSSRSESVINRLETYKYDNLDRLTQVKSGKIGMTGTAKAFSYENNGNIEQSHTKINGKR